MPQSGLAGSCDNSIFSFFVEPPYCFSAPIDYTNLQSHQQCKAVVMHWLLQIHWCVGQMRGHIGNHPMRNKKSFVTVRNWLCTIGLWYSSVFCCWVQACCMNIPYSAYPFTCWWTLSCFQFLAVQNKGGTNKKTLYICILQTYIFCEHIFSLLFWKLSRHETAGSYGRWLLALWVAAKFSKVFYHHTFSNNVWMFQLLHFLANRVGISLF